MKNLKVGFSVSERHKITLYLYDSIAIPKKYIVKWVLLFSWKMSLYHLYIRLGYTK